MTEHRRDDTVYWLEHLARRGHPAARPLGAGVEGAVYRLEPGLVAKVWSGGQPARLSLIRRVYADLARHPLPFATPQILDVEEHRGVLLTYERELAGVPLRKDSAVEPAGERLSSREIDALLTVLRGLATVAGTEAMRRLTVRGDDRPLWQGHRVFPEALAALVERAVGRHRELLAAHVRGLDSIVRWAVRSLIALGDTRVTVVHGDLVPPNIHVDDRGRPAAVLDFGFFTTAGDPAFEAAVTAAVWDMYGPHAEAHLARLTRLFAVELGCDPDVLALYQAVYALTTYDLFAADGGDGHFRWCAALLNRGAFGR